MPSPFRLRLCALIAGLSFMVGCSSDPKPTGDKDTKQTSNTSTESEGKGKVAPKPEQTSQEFAKAFLDSLGGGKAKTEDLSLSFKKLLAPPTFEEEKKAGFSDTNVKKWLDAKGKGNGDAGATFIGTSFLPTPNDKGLSIRGEVSGLPKVERFALRVDKTSTGTWEVTWFHRTTTTSTVPAEGAASELLQARDVAMNFIDSLTGGDTIIAEALMKTSLKESIGGAATASDKAKGLTYDENFLRTKLKGYRDFASYAVTKQQMQPGDNIATFSGELKGAGDKKQNFNIKLTKDAAGVDWQIEEFKE